MRAHGSNATRARDRSTVHYIEETSTIYNVIRNLIFQSLLFAIQSASDCQEPYLQERLLPSIALLTFVLFIVCSFLLVIGPGCKRIILDTFSTLLQDYHDGSGDVAQEQNEKHCAKHRHVPRSLWMECQFVQGICIIKLEQVTAEEER